MRRDWHRRSGNRGHGNANIIELYGGEVEEGLHSVSHIDRIVFRRWRVEKVYFAAGRRASQETNARSRDVGHSSEVVADDSQHVWMANIRPFATNDELKLDGDRHR